jgi:hypothetical protein
MITAEENGTKPQGRDVVSAFLEKNGEMLLGCSGRRTLRREQYYNHFYAHIFKMVSLLSVVFPKTVRTSIAFCPCVLYVPPILSPFIK